ncbi:hypothetical protein V8C37DRAFT_406649 [Trichoderma ceciliae]
MSAINQDGMYTPESSVAPESKPQEESPKTDAEKEIDRIMELHPQVTKVQKAKDAFKKVNEAGMKLHVSPDMVTKMNAWDGKGGFNNDGKNLEDTKKQLLRIKDIPIEQYKKILQLDTFTKDELQDEGKVVEAWATIANSLLPLSEDAKDGFKKVEEAARSAGIQNWMIMALKEGNGQVSWSDCIKKAREKRQNQGKSAVDRIQKCDSEDYDAILGFPKGEGRNETGDHILTAWTQQACVVHPNVLDYEGANDALRKLRKAVEAFIPSSDELLSQMDHWEGKFEWDHEHDEDDDKLDVDMEDRNYSTGT